eukprot:COSAG06_NODE_41044_length_395_cov_2.422297_1_plen_53_part_01
MTPIRYSSAARQSQVTSHAYELHHEVRACALMARRSLLSCSLSLCLSLSVYLY